ncbi:uncharacterized protein FFUJ_12772 [Fusarium fujikuroi IMI 58289]|uniref:Fungal N-terminal domain-containing protein n=1 Tax=Gibberella fujikuroi (strain CBS 195.34 / IMI 58289 / NRRL A-6831) TaxID=1279085 RepID=S0EKE8_GIBF5|nr:uncharacterized protein FFUJ_12772 [Fusarium fujikuroi IMI 58289]SCO19600.1 uncharacterized protein FFE2_14375 [Fusarium fujikuroi]CCT72878.1 uncharacterized protein FFUJ_12772 [Fusarium fujikuroi IMI 58289]SCO25030.1 uncharacterized protein FFM5_13929 [Fusarium fujikuroi]SCO25198.1 uncharacterized protein FFC1_15384 [Fusarium fujikuroi]SCO52601.1 uncharacterized protein FFNC_14380 [Fusarium fujikuroi]
MANNEASVSIPTNAARARWQIAIAEHTKCEGFRNRIRSFLLNLNTMMQSLQTNSRNAGPDTDLGGSMAALSQEMFIKTREMDRAVAELNDIHTEFDVRKPVVEAYLGLGSGSAAGTLPETVVALRYLESFEIGNASLKQMWDGLMACSRQAHMLSHVNRR